MDSSFEKKLRKYLALVNKQRECMREAKKAVAACDKLAREADKLSDELGELQERLDIGTSDVRDVIDELEFKHESEDSVLEALGESARASIGVDAAVKKIGRHIYD